MPFAAVIPELFSAGLGLYQMAKGDKMGKVDRPTYHIPEANQEALDISRELASSREAPGTENTLNALETGLANTLEAGRSTGRVDAGQLYRNHTNALLQIGDQNEAFRERGLGNLIGQLNNFGALQEKAWQYNVNDPYQIQVETAKELKNAGLINTFNALDSAIAKSLMAKTTDSMKTEVPGTTAKPTSLQTDAVQSSSVTGPLEIPGANNNLDMNEILRIMSQTLKSGSNPMGVLSKGG